MKDGSVNYRTRFRCTRCRWYINEQFLAFHIFMSHIAPWRTTL